MHGKSVFVATKIGIVDLGRVILRSSTLISCCCPDTMHVLHEQVLIKLPNIKTEEGERGAGYTNVQWMGARDRARGEATNKGLEAHVIARCPDC